MTNTPSEVDAYARAHPTRDGGSWAGWCASFCYRAGGFVNSFVNAMAAGDASGPLNSSYAAAPRGAIHYWAGVGGDGHVAFDMGGNILLMASNAVSNYGTALGTISFAEYAKRGIPYRGWSLRWGNETLDLTDTAGGGTSPIIEGHNIMGIVYRLYHASADSSQIALIEQNPRWNRSDDPFSAVTGVRSQLEDWVQLYGPSTGLTPVIWDAVMNAKNRVKTFRVESTTPGTPSAPSTGATKAEVQAISDASDKALKSAIDASGKKVIAAIPTKATLVP